MKFARQVRERPLDAASAADEHVIGARYARDGKDLAGKHSKPTLHPIADDGAADLLGDGDAEAHRGIAILPLTHEQDETGHGRAAAAIGGQEVGAAGKRRRRGQRGDRL